MILVTALSLTDARLYEAADALGTGRARKFWTITLPGAKYGLISAAMVVFTYSLSDFGIPKVIGGNFNMLATDIFKLVIGQQDFAKGAVVAIILLAPVAVTWLVDGWVQKRQSALLSARSVPYVPRPSRGFDRAMAAYCWLMAALMLAVLGMAVYASFVTLWPYDFSLSLDHYRMGLVEAGIFPSYLNSVTMALWCASLGDGLRLRHRLRAREDARPGRLAPLRAPGGGAAHGRSGHGAGTGVHLLLRREVQSAPRALRQHGDSRGVHHRALLHVVAPHGAHRAQAARQRVRGGVGVAPGRRSGAPSRG